MSEEELVGERVKELLSGDTSDRRAFLGRQYDLGLAWVHFPEGSGGLALPPGLQRIVTEAITAP